MVIFGFLLILAGAIVIFVNSDELFLSYLGTILVIFGFAVALSNVQSDEPTAMDVYQGKTTLEIIYKDGVPVDSVVVFKDK